MGSVRNIQKFLQKLKQAATPETRIVISHYNELWRPLLVLAEKWRLKTPEKFINWLSIEDIENFLYLSGYQVIRRSFLILFPFYIPLISVFFNKFLCKIPVLRRFALTQVLVARVIPEPTKPEEMSCSVILTCRDEEENIEGLVERIPNMGAHTEIIFVEGHSKDRTVEKIEEMMRKYPHKEIKLLKQKGIGQADAYRLGFSEAKGDLLCWMEADLTIPPGEINLFWEAFISGKGEYFNGSRFIYQMEKNAMPFFNILGNRFFANLFTLILGQRYTDTLCGFKAISRSNYAKVQKQLYYFGNFDPFGDFELIFGVTKHCLKLVEIPVHYRPREYGEPKAYGKSFFSFIKHALLLMRMSRIAFKAFS